LTGTIVSSFALAEVVSTILPHDQHIIVQSVFDTEFLVGIEYLNVFSVCFGLFDEFLASIVEFVVA